MDEATASPAEQEAPAPSRRGDRWQHLRELRKNANKDRSAGEWLDLGLAGLTTVGTYALIGLGFSVSYGTIRQIARDEGHFSQQMSHVAPLSFEGGIIILSLYVIREARRGKRAMLLRLIIAVCCLATLQTNWSAATTAAGKLTHVVPVAMFIICYEWLIHSARTKALDDMGLTPPPLPVLRSVEWGLDFFNTFARWRLMALHHIHSTEQAMWVRQTLAVRKSKLQDDHDGKWRNVPKHVRLEMRAQVLAEGERLFAPAGTDDAASGRYTDLVAKLSRTDTPAIPAPRSEDSAGTSRRELENPDEQTALPPGTQTTTTSPEGDMPYAVTDTGMTIASPAPEPFDQDGGHDAERQLARTAPQARARAAETPWAPTVVTIETSSERDERQEREDIERQEQQNHDRQMNETYRKILDVIHDLTASNQPVNGPAIADDPRVGVGARSVQRHIRKMKEEGLLPEDLIQ